MRCFSFSILSQKRGQDYQSIVMYSCAHIFMRFTLHVNFVANKLSIMLQQETQSIAHNSHCSPLVLDKTYNSRHDYKNSSGIYDEDIIQSCSISNHKRYDTVYYSWVGQWILKHQTSILRYQTSQMLAVFHLQV